MSFGGVLCWRLCPYEEVSTLLYYKPAPTINQTLTLVSMIHPNMAASGGTSNNINFDMNQSVLVFLCHLLRFFFVALGRGLVETINLENSLSKLFLICDCKYLVVTDEAILVSLQFVISWHFIICLDSAFPSFLQNFFLGTENFSIRRFYQSLLGKV